jgi:3-deoxy-D-manno-octulosonic-acid transferase
MSGPAPSLRVRLLRVLYRALWWLVAPCAVVRLIWRSRQERGYIRHIGERFGFGAAWRGDAAKQRLIWVHAVSVGETRAAQPLIAALQAAHPDAQILITHMTPAGRATSEALFGDRLLRSYLPYDMRGPVRRFLRRYRPSLGIVMETEVWPTLIDECERAGMPLVLVNARMSARSSRRAARFGAAARSVFGGLTAVLAQTTADAERLAELGARSPQVLGNLKFDVQIDVGLRETGRRWREAIGTRPVWVATSTREGEEALILEAFARQLAVGPANALLILVPRHPQRFAEVAALATQSWRTQRRSVWANAAPGREPLADLPGDVQVLIGDSMGELVAYYVAADVAFIGGSLVPTGGQNLIEAAAVSRPVIVGPHTFNFTQASADAIAAGAAERVDSPAALGEAMAVLLSDDAKRASMGVAAQAFADRDRGATARTVTALSRYLQG